MKKPTPKQVFIIVIAAAVLIPLLVFGWIEIQKEPLDLTMYGAEIDSQGNIIRETEFRLTGYLTNAKYGNIIPYPESYRIVLDPIVFEGIEEMNSKIHKFENPMFITGNIHNPYYSAYLTATDIHTGDFRDWTLYLCNNMCHCIVKAEGRIFIGSVKPGDDILSILEYFPEDILQ